MYYKRMLYDKELRTRTISAIAILAIAVVPIVVGDWFFVLALAVLSWFLAREWVFLSRAEEELIFTILLIVAILLALTVLPFYGARVAFASCVFSSVIGLTFSSAYKRELLFVFLLGLFFLPLTLISLATIRYYDNGLLLLLWLISIITVTDTGAFFAGKIIQGPKILKSISPNKTWSGAIGGTVLAVMVSLGFVLFFLPHWSYTLATITAVLISVVSQVGDFTVSAIKRHNKMKDTGHLIPGHGGLFDRFDGYLFAPPVMVFIIYFREAFLL